MSKGNKFGFDPIEPTPVQPRTRDPGPMSKAVRETADSVARETEAMLEQRKRNAADAKSFRAAQADGLVMIALPLDAIHTTALPRDRIDLDAVAQSDEMEELRVSIRARGQKEPIEVFVDAAGQYQLKKGWRRLTALRQLFEETGDPEFSKVIARETVGAEIQITRYTDMVEENVIRENLSFAEMAQVAILAAADPEVIETDADALCGRLYASFHKMKRSYVRSFVYLLQALGEDLKWPKDVSRNVGVEVARRLRSGEISVDVLRAALVTAGDPESQARVLKAALVDEAGAGDPPSKKARPQKEKREFRLGDVKVTARDGECRIVAPVDFASVDRALLDEAVAAFNEVLRGR